MIRFIFSIVTGLIFFFVGTILMYVESWFMENKLEVSPFPGMTQQKWLLDFQGTAFLELLCALLFILVWCFAGYFYYQIVDWHKSGGRRFWIALFALMLFILSVSGWVLTTPAQGFAKIISMIFYLLNGAIVYWGASLLLSPATVKYAPWGSQLSPVNRIWLRKV